MVGQTTQSQNHFRQRIPTPSTASPDWMLPFERGLEPHERLTSGCIKLLPWQIGERLGSVITTSLAERVFQSASLCGCTAAPLSSSPFKVLFCVWCRRERRGCSPHLAPCDKWRQSRISRVRSLLLLRESSLRLARAHGGGRARAPIPSSLLKSAGIFAPIKRITAISLPRQTGRRARARSPHPFHRFNIVLIPLTIIAIKHSS